MNVTPGDPETTREWLERIQAGDGQAAEATMKWKYVDDGTMVWTAEGRTADERPLPDLTVTFVRKGAKAK